jgi:multiple sugar transport system permease protein
MSFDIRNTPLIPDQTEDRDLLPYLLVGPTIVTVFLVTIGPLIWSLWLSLNRWRPGSLRYQTPQLTGLSNFEWVFTTGRFWNSIINFAYYGGVGVTLQVILGLGLALALYNYVENRAIRVGLLTLFAVPMMIAPIVAGRVFQLIFLPGGGLINTTLASMGLPQPGWLLSRWLGLTSIMIADTWQWVGLPLLIIYGGRSSIPESLYEAAKIDGASRWMMFRRITLPRLRNLIAIAFLLRFMDAFKYFDKMFIMTSGGPGTATELPTYYAYLVGFSNFFIGHAAALTWVLGLGTVVAIFLFWNFARGSGGGL